ncbi:motility protein A [Clostridia bacterium]|nr:motility protein A [Clostridia bacterium]
MRTKKIKKIDYTTIIGWGVGILLILLAISFNVDRYTGSVNFNLKLASNFFDIPSVFIVFGGTFCVLFASYPIEFFKRVKTHLKVVIFPPQYSPALYIRAIVALAKSARMNGLLSIEEKVSNLDDVFLRNSLLMVIDSVEAQKVKISMETELDYLDARHSQDIEMYIKGSEYAPAFGMLGTLIGLINLLKNLTNQDALVQNMAVALVTTFYGVIIANLFFKPMAVKLQTRHDEEMLCKTIIAEGVMAIQDGDNPKFIEEKLMRLLAKQPNLNVNKINSNKAKTVKSNNVRPKNNTVKKK